METWEWIVIVAVAAAAVLLLVGLAGWLGRKRRRERLQERFGDEYDRSVSSEGKRTAERRLSEVEKEHEQLDIRPLSPAARDRYLEEWRQAEARFVNDPELAARSAEGIVARLLEDRGYPTGTGTETQAAHVAVDHPDVVERYRHGHAMLDTDGDQHTENLRKAMIDFRAVFEELAVVEEREVTRT